MTEKVLTFKKFNIPIKEAKKYGPPKIRTLVKTYIHKHNGGLTITLEEKTPEIKSFERDNGTKHEYYSTDLRLCFDYFGIWKTAFPLTAESLRQIAFALFEGAEKSTFGPEKHELMGENDDYRHRGEIFHFTPMQLARRRVLLENEMKFLKTLESLMNHQGQAGTSRDYDDEELANFLAGKKTSEPPPFPKVDFAKVPSDEDDEDEDD